MMAKSPLMYSGAVPADPVTLNLLTSPVALKINAESSDLRVAYSGNCSCRVLSSGTACEPLAHTCTALWWSTLGKCKAVATINIGSEDTDVAVDMASIGLPPGVPHTLTYIYEKTSAVVHNSSLRIPTAAMGGVLLVLSPAGVAAIDC
jgi:hypothetical protein